MTVEGLGGLAVKIFSHLTRPRPKRWFTQKIAQLAVFRVLQLFHNGQVEVTYVRSIGKVKGFSSTRFRLVGL